MKSLIPILLLAISIQPLLAQPDSGAEGQHVVRPGSTSQTPVTTDGMWQRIRGAAQQYAQYAPVPRMAFNDVTYPATVDEFRALNGYGLMLITVMTQDANEVPLARVVLNSTDGTHVFELLGSIRSPVDDAAIARVLGNTRYDALYLFPVHLRQASGELLVDFAANRTGFVLTRFPLPPLDIQLPADPPSAAAPPAAALQAMLRRELPLFLEAGSSGP